nr:DNRLRE domain-containing protein [uncultured Pedobacter sp.]
MKGNLFFLKSAVAVGLLTFSQMSAYSQFSFKAPKTITAATPNGNGGLGPSSDNETNTLNDFTETQSLRSTYLGASDRYVGNSKGYFHTYKDTDGMWSFVDPDGYIFYSVGMNSVNTGSDQQSSLKSNLRVNTLSKWSGSFTKTMPYMVSLDFAFNYKNTQGARGDALFANGILPIFDVTTSSGTGVTYTAGFVNYCATKANEVITSSIKNDKLVLGYFSDNEVPLANPYGQYLVNIWTTLSNYQGYTGALGSNDPNYIAARNWVKARHGGNFTINQADKDEFPNYIVGKYYQVCRDAIRAEDTNHLFMGSRLHQDLDNPNQFSAARQYLDVISVNYYRRWTAESNTLHTWQGTAPYDKPFIITEFYAMAESSGYTNRSGAGWVVNTQQDRADFFENFTTRLLKFKNCIGFHWFRYQDDGTASKNNGVVKSDFSYWPELKNSFYKVAKNIYNLRDWIVNGNGEINKDTYLRDGSYGNTVYGTSSDIEVKENSSSGFNRQGVIMVTANVTSASQINSAKLKLYCNSISGTTPYSGNVALYKYPADWYESTLNYNNRHVSNPLELVATKFVNTENSYVTWDITDYIKGRATDGNLTSAFIIISDSQALMTFASRENSTHKPLFEINGVAYNTNSVVANNNNAETLVLDNQLDKASGLQPIVYPNPVKNILNVKLAKAYSSAGLRVSDITGKVIYEVDFSNQIQKSIDVSNLTSGIYIISLNAFGVEQKEFKFLKE